ncbi:uncharacterized protein LOC117587753 [Drosophila guanche]|uniref:Blast:FUN14 domain-containing protein 2 n=1 Tax=Drosophila guanche TaxID=7266 RepID=A0A3B0JVA3_DROGU|nr:uncharacterized protein LOC117587753 [Drosophila guanche]SPP86027.1 blast:FUN14 domain-containing protein 2 [Drosophila guanche]
MCENWDTKDALDGLSRRSPYTQIALGAGTGFLTGYVLFKASKVAAIVAGGTILVLQLAVQTGVIKSSPLETIVLQGYPRNSGNVRGQPTAATNSQSPREQLTKPYDVIAGSSRICVAIFGGFLLGFGLA